MNSAQCPAVVFYCIFFVFSLIIINVVKTFRSRFVHVMKKVKVNHTLIFFVQQIKNTSSLLCELSRVCYELTIFAVPSQDTIDQGSRYPHPFRPPAGGAVPRSAHGPQRQCFWSPGGSNSTQPLCADIRQPAEPSQ